MRTSRPAPSRISPRCATASSTTRPSPPARRCSTSGAATGSSRSARSSEVRGASSSRTSPSRCSPSAARSPASSGSRTAATSSSLVRDKPRAFAEFFRVLRPGGRLSIFEPINSFGMEERRREFLGFDDGDIGPIAAKLDAVFARAQPQDDPMLDFDEHDLIRQAETAGFFPVRADVRFVVEPQEPRSWDGFLHSSGNPNIPTFAEAMASALTSHEKERYSGYLRPRVEGGLGRFRMGSAYLRAKKPG